MYLLPENRRKQLQRHPHLKLWKSIATKRKQRAKMQEDFRPVCQHCMVICERKYKDEPGRGRYTYSECPMCGNCDPELGVDDCGMSVEELEGQLRLQKFVRGIDDASINTEPDGAD